MNHKQGILAISPLIVFVILYFVSSIIAGDFYMMPITVAFMLSCIYAIMTFRGRSVKDRVETFGIGAGEKNI